MRINYKLCITSLLAIFAILNATGQNIDSLVTLTHTGNNEQKINANIALSEYFFYSIPDTAEYFLNQALVIAKKEKTRKKEGAINLNIGILYNERGLTDIAEKYFLEAISISKAINDSSLWIAALGNMGNSAMYVGNYSKALEYSTQIVELFKEKKNNIGLGKAYGQMGNIYMSTKEYDKALHYYNEAKDYFLLENDSLSAAVTTMNVAAIHNRKKQYELAIEKFTIARKILKKYNQKVNEAICWSGLADIYRTKKQLNKSYNHYTKALEIYKEVDSKTKIAICYNDIGFVKAKEGNVPQALAYYDSAYSVAYKLKNYLLLSNLTKDFQDIYYQQKKYAKAYEYAVLNKTFSDSLINTESAKKFRELEVKFETKQKQQQIELLTKENKITEARNSVKNLVIAILVISFLAATLIYILLTNRRKMITKAIMKQNEEILLKNKQILEQKEEIQNIAKTLEATNKEIEYKNKQITHSIEYAKLIQTAAMPTKEQMQALLPSHFIFFKPRDIVSGDYYWIREIKNLVIVVAADCTGHGIPGAFMSMLGISLYNEIARRPEINNLAMSLDALRNELKNTLGQTGDIEENKDGINLSVIAIDREKRQLQYAGAHNPIFIAKNNELKIYKADEMPVGISHKEKPFTNKIIEINSGDIIYMFSDGYADQFGGNENRKFTNKRFKKLINNNKHKPMREQYEIIKNRHERWAKNQKQIDDILVIGIKIEEEMFIKQKT